MVTVNNSLHKLAENPKIESAEKIEIPKPSIKMTKKKKENAEEKDESEEKKP